MSACVLLHECAFTCLHLSVYVCESPHEDMPLYHKNRSQLSGCVPVPVLSRWTLNYYWSVCVSLSSLPLSLLFNWTIFQRMRSLQMPIRVKQSWELLRLGYKMKQVVALINHQAASRHRWGGMRLLERPSYINAYKKSSDMFDSGENYLKGKLSASPHT